MDIWTRRDGDAAAWILPAMGGVLRMRPADLVLPSGPPAAGRSAGRRWLPGGAGRHGVVEIALALREGLMAIEGAVRRFGPPAVAILPPGVFHCEGAAGARRPYLSLWLNGGGGALFAIVSRYRPGRGWDTPWRGVLRGATARRLLFPLEATGAAEALVRDRAQFERFRAGVLAVLAELYRHDVEAAPRTAGEGRADSPLAHAAVLAHIRLFLEENLHRPIALSDAARLTRLTPRYLNRLFSRRFGVPIHAFLVARRMARALSLLKSTDLLAKEVAGRVGYSDPLYFSRCFRRHFGRAPSSLR
jgi:AraC-like DNA-binding protein